MVTLTYTVENIARLVLYNEKKVDQGQAQCLMAGNMPLAAEDLSLNQKKQYLTNRCSLNANIRLPVLHAILGFHPLDSWLSGDQFQQIAARYMELIGFSQQPYLVYKHMDTFHPHLHVVSSNILPSSRQIYTHRLGYRFSFPAAKILEEEFGLIQAVKKWKEEKTSKPQIKQLEYGKQPVVKNLTQILRYLQQNYHFSDLMEWNALLRPFRIIALPGKYHSRKNGTLGLYYFLLDQDHQIVSKGIPEGKLSISTAQEICKKFADTSLDIPFKSYLRTVLYPLKHSQNKSIEKQLAALRGQGIELIEISLTKKAPGELIVIDHQMKYAISEGRLGLDFQISDYLQQSKQTVSKIVTENTLSNVSKRNLKMSSS